MDFLLAAWMSGLIELSKLRHIFGKAERWKPGRPLRLLFAGYNGARNTGADVRVDGMVRQIRHVLGPKNVEAAVCSLDFELTKGYFDGARQIRLPPIFPPFLFREVPRYDGVVACEGSMFKSKFADALTVMMVGALGTAAAYNRISVGYGGEAGKMNRVPRWMTRRYVRESLVITRSEESRETLRDLDIPCDLGTDTAWTFEPLPAEYGEAELRKAGWDGRPILAVCPINPFWWPVKASLLKGVARLVGGFRESHYKSLYFHRAGPAVTAAYERYLDGIAKAVAAFRQRANAYVILVAMERLDTDACRRLSPKLNDAPVFSSNDYDMYQLVSIARSARAMVSSRYHGIVTTMPAGVASGGITMDERIRNLMRQRGQTELFCEVDDEDLEPKLLEMLDTLWRDGERIRAGIGQTVVQHLKEMARMGAIFENNVRKRYPEFPTRSGVRSWEEYLPPLPDALRQLAEVHA